MSKVVTKYCYIDFSIFFDRPEANERVQIWLPYPRRYQKKWNAFFPKVQITATAEKLTLLTPGDFNTIYSTLRFYDDSEISPEIIENALKSEIAYKDNRAGRVMGF